MSDQSTLSPLRLKPRARPEGESPSVEVPRLTSDASGAESEFPKLRLKPKLNAEEPTKSAAVESPSAPAAMQTPLSSPSPERAAAPALGIPPAAAVPIAATVPMAAAPNEVAALVPPAAPLPDTPSFKFKVKSPDSVATAASPTSAPQEVPPPVPEVPPAAPKFPPPPPPRAPAPAKQELPSFPPPPVPHLKASVIEERPQPVASVTSPSPLKKYLGLAAGVVLVAAAGFTYRTLRSPSPPPPVVAPQQKAPTPVTVAPTPAPVAPVAASEPAHKDPAPPVAAAPTNVTPPAPPPKPKGPTPSDTLNQLAGAPLRAINKAKAAVAAHADSTSDIPAIGAPAPARKVAATTDTGVSTGVVATVAVANAADTASDEFRAWAGHARISGVFQGTPPRALINGRTVRAGEIVDDALSITFDSFDATNRRIVFRDSTGATVARKF